MSHGVLRFDLIDFIILSVISVALKAINFLLILLIFILRYTWQTATRNIVFLASRIGLFSLFEAEINDIWFGNKAKDRRPKKSLRFLFGIERQSKRKTDITHYSAGQELKTEVFKYGGDEVTYLYHSESTALRIQWDPKTVCVHTYAHAL